MAKRKTFTSGQAVEVQREAGRHTWEPATYRNAANYMGSRSGYHWVQLPSSAAPHWVDPASGMHYTEGDIEGRRYKTDKLLVPSVRVRASKREQ